MKDKYGTWLDQRAKLSVIRNKTIISIIDKYALKEWLWRYVIDIETYEGDRIVRLDSDDEYCYYLEDYINEKWVWVEEDDDDYPYSLYIGGYKVDDFTEDIMSAYKQAVSRLDYFMIR